ncbi:carbohydrate-binding domain-containing protein [Nocardioides sp. URHA0020]|uniref:carbohydrate-binding domain-containing protein n=1 Tax=Nocardioides sp. URHA0020 TaxID=1380392 RepID=UPI0006854756|nr:carbohydrate-binding domain-containing protein [Nocardioides sp. URHA0020]
MKKTTLRHRMAALGTAAVLTLATACGSSADGGTTATGTSGGTGTVASATAFMTLDDTHADTDDGDYSADGATTIALADGGTEVDGDGATVKGDVVTITTAGTYIVSGTLTDGQIVVDSPGDGKVDIVLDNADITSASTSPLVVTEADEAVVILAADSVNSLADAAASTADDDSDDAPTATLFSMADLTIAGTGTLEVAGNSNDGIASKDGLVILSGTIDVTATDDGIRGKDYLVIAGGTLDVTSGGDGLKSDNETEGEPGTVQLDAGQVTISAGDDGVDAIGAINVADGTLTVAKSTEGLEAAQISIADGTVDVTAQDDGINATNGETAGGGEDAQEGVLASISGGDVHVVVAQGDGIDSNGSATITGGTTVVEAGSAGGGGTGSLDVNGSFPVTGGTLVALGGMSSAPSTDSDEGWVAATLTTPAEAGQVVAVVDSDGDVVARYVVPEATSSVIVAAEGITNGQDHDLYVGDAGSDTGFSTGGSTSGLTKAGTVTAGEFTGGMGGGRGGGPRGGDGGGPGGPPEDDTSAGSGTT